MRNPKRTFKALSLSILFAALLIIGAAPSYAESDYDSETVKFIERLRQVISPRFPYLWIENDYSLWTGLTWSDRQPRQLVAIDLPGPHYDESQGSLFVGCLEIKGLDSLEKLRVKNLNSEAFSRNGRLQHVFHTIELRDLPNLKSLDIGDERIRSNRLLYLSSIEKMPRLEELNLSGSGYNPNDYSPLAKLTNLHSLTLDHSTLTDAYYLKDLTNLKRLSLRDIRNYLTVSSFRAPRLSWETRVGPMRVDYLDNLRLEVLDLSQNGIARIEGLEAQSSLEELYLSSNKITEIRGLDNLTNLKILNLKGNYIEKIDNLDNLGQLTTLNFAANRIAEISGLENLTNLTCLNLMSNPLSEIKGLDNLTALMSLEVDRVREIKGLSALKNLKRLTITDSLKSPVPVTRITGLDNNTALEYLKLNTHHISSLDGLKPLRKLRHLDLSNNKLTDLGTMPPLPELIYLNLRFNRLEALDGIQKLPALTSLDLAANFELKDLRPLTGLPKLKKLILMQMNYEDFRGFESSSLTELNLANNRLKRFPGLEGLTSLEELDLSHNKIADLDCPSARPALKRLDLSQNPLSSANELLKTFPSLEHLLLTRCGLTGPIDLSGLSRLEYLDLSRNQISDISGWSDLPAGAIINLKDNSLPLSLFQALKKDSQVSGRQWRLGAKQKHLLGDITGNAGTEIDLSREFELDGTFTRFKVVRDVSRRETEILMTEDYESLEALDRERAAMSKQQLAAEPSLVGDRNICDFDRGRFVFFKPGNYRIYMYNDQIAYDRPINEKHKDNVVEVSTGLITIN